MTVSTSAIASRSDSALTSSLVAGNAAEGSGDVDRRGLGGDAALLQRHAGGGQSDTALPDASQCRAAVQSARRRHDQPADEGAEYDADDQDDDRGDDARDVAHQ